jgi:hypothetical protein
MTNDIKKGDYKNLDLLHHLTSGGKSVMTQDTHDSMILIRQSLGGAGYSAWSGIPYLMDDYSPEITFEGDNTVMAQQSFNYLRKLLKKLEKGKQIKDHGFFEYLNEIPTLMNMKCSGRDSSHFLAIENVLTALKVNLAVKMHRIAVQIKESKVSQKDFTNIHNATDIVKVAKEHFRYMSFWIFA